MIRGMHTGNEKNSGGVAKDRPRIAWAIPLGSA